MDILEQTGLPSIENLLIRTNLRWTGHLMRMSPDRLPKQILYSQLSSGHRKRGRPRLRFKDTIKRNLKLRDIKTDSWTSLSQQRDKWRAIVMDYLSHHDRQHNDDDICMCSQRLRMAFIIFMALYECDASCYYCLYCRVYNPHFSSHFLCNCLFMPGRL